MPIEHPTPARLALLLMLAAPAACDPRQEGTVLTPHDSSLGGARASGGE
jgi:hypothetical protein